jgi:hypothetical protein
MEGCAEIIGVRGYVYPETVGGGTNRMICLIEHGLAYRGGNEYMRLECPRWRLNRINTIALWTPERRLRRACRPNLRARRVKAPEGAKLLT